MTITHLIQLCNFPKTLIYLNLAHIRLQKCRKCLDLQMLTNLHTLILSKTGIDHIPRCPKSLRVLDVSSNNILFPCIYLNDEQIDVIVNLETLVIYGNEQITIPKATRIPLHILQF